MSRKPLATMTALALAGAALAGCSSSDPDEAGAASPDAMESTPAAEDVAAPAGAGSATLVVGDETIQFDSFVCAFGYDNTQSTTYSFSSNSFQVLDGVNVQMQLNVADPSGDDALTGPDTAPEIDVQDIDDFENPAVGIFSDSLDVSFDGDDISAEGTFFDEIADPMRQDELPGTFEATCGAGSLR